MLTNELYFRSINSVRITAVTWNSNSQNEKQEARFLSRTSPFQVTVDNSVFNCAEGHTGINNVTLTADPKDFVGRASLFHLVGSGVEEDLFISNTYMKCQEAYKGGVFSL